MSVSPALVSLFGMLHQSALGQELTNDVFVQYNIANGLTRDNVRRGRGNNNEVIAGPIFTPLSKYLNNISVIDTLRNVNGTYQHGNGEAAWTCAGDYRNIGAAGGGLGFDGPSLDWRIAEALSDEPAQASALLGLPYRMGGGNCGAQKTISASAAGKKITPEFDVYQAWEKYFDVTSITNNQRAFKQINLISKVMEDTRRQMNLLPAHEKAKADQYLDSLNELEKSLAPPDNVLACLDTPQPQNLDLSQGGISSAFNNAVHLPKYWQAVVDLGANLIGCGLKQQVTLLHSMACAHMRYDSGRGDGSMLDHHWHDSNPSFNGGETGDDMDRILAMHTGYVNSILDKLSEIPGFTPGETLLDRTKIMLGSDGGGRHHSGWDKYCLILFAGDKTNLVKGRYIDGDGRPLADFLLTMLKSFDPSADFFGDGANGGGSTINELFSG